MWVKLAATGVPKSFLNRIRDQFSNIRGKIRLGNLVTDEFDIASGVVQGSRLGPILFDIFLNDLLGDLKKNSKGVAIANDIKVHCLAYADDLCLIAEKEIELQNMLQICSKWAIKNGMAFCTGVLLHATMNAANENPVVFRKLLRESPAVSCTAFTDGKSLQLQFFSHDLSS